MLDGCNRIFQVYKKLVGILNTLDIINSIKRYSKKIILIFFSNILIILCILFKPLLLGKVITALLDGSFIRLINIIKFLFIIYLVETVLKFVKSYATISLNKKMLNDLRVRLFDSLLNLKVKIFDDMKIGHTISIIHTDTKLVVDTISNFILDSVIDITSILFLILFMLRMNVYLSLIVILNALLVLVIFIISGKRIRLKNKKIKKMNDKYISFTQQTIWSVREIKALGIKHERLYDFIKMSKEMNDMTENYLLTSISYQNIINIVNFASEILSIIISSYFIYKKALQIEYFVAFSSYSRLLSKSLINIVSSNSKLQDAVTSAIRIQSILETTNKKEEFGKKFINFNGGTLSFKNVSYKYTNKIHVLDNVTFNIQPNTIVGLVGASGVGKSTIANLLLRFYDVNSGKITIKNVNIEDLSEKCIRENISVVRQEPLLFNTTIRENILIGNLYKTEEDMYEACKKAHIHDEIIALENGYDTVINENSVNLSAGQKQRIAIARALIKGSFILIFDEITSALDNETQKRINNTILEIAKDHTIIIIAHRLENIIHSSKVILLKDKGVCEISTKNYLEKNKFFA